eukprot:2140434-Pleurochrysis_carterae.AAC.1
MVYRFCIASHAYSRGACAPLPKLLETLACDGRRRFVSTLLEPPCRRTPARAPALALSPRR